MSKRRDLLFPSLAEDYVTERLRIEEEARRAELQSFADRNSFDTSEPSYGYVNQD